MQDIAVITICGRVTGTPEEKKHDNGDSSVSFDIAVNVEKDTVNFYRVRCFGYLGEIAKEQLAKGARCTVIGRFSMALSSAGKAYLNITASAIYPGSWKKREETGPDPDSVPWEDDIDVI